MSEIEELRARANAVAAKRASVALSVDEAETAKLLTQIAEDEAEAAAAARARREIAGRAAEAAARREAKSGYLVAFVDLAAMLLTAEPETLPGGGVLVVRSPPVHPVPVLEVFYRDVAAGEDARPLLDLYCDLVCGCIVTPSTDGAEGIRLRTFFESSLGRGTLISLGNVITRLGGTVAKTTKRRG